MTPKELSDIRRKLKVLNYAKEKRSVTPLRPAAGLLVRPDSTRAQISRLRRVFIGLAAVIIHLCHLPSHPKHFTGVLKISSSMFSANIPSLTPS